MSNLILGSKANSNLKLVKCVACAGCGWVQGPFSDYNTWQCVNCQGSGRIFIEKDKDEDSRTAAD